MKDISGTKIFCMALTALMFSLMLIPAGSAAIGVKAGDWIKYASSDAPSEWIKIEFLSVEETTATISLTTSMSDEEEQNNTMTGDVEAGCGNFEGFPGLFIPANSKVGDSLNLAEFDNVTIVRNVTIDGEKTRKCAGASRTVVYASFSEDLAQITYYWDKQTGVAVEMSMTAGFTTMTIKATKTSMWEAEAVSFITQWWFWAIIIVIVVIIIVAAGSAVLLRRRSRLSRKRRPHLRKSESTTKIS